MSMTKDKVKGKTAVPRQLTAAALRKLPPAKRSAFLRAAAKRAEPLYRKGGPLRDFEAFGEDDLHVDSSNTQTR